MTAAAVRAVDGREIVCECGEPLARVSRYGVSRGLYPFERVRAEFEDGRALLYCPACGARVKLTITPRMS